MVNLMLPSIPPTGIACTSTPGPDTIPDEMMLGCLREDLRLPRGVEPEDSMSLEANGRLRFGAL